MALLALTVALLAVPVATMAMEEVALDMAPASFDDQYRDCGLAMSRALPALKRSDFQNNAEFARVWPEAESKWQGRESRVSPLSPAQASAITAYTMNYLYKDFNEKVSVAGISPQQYRQNFHYKTLHFLLTDALATLRDAGKGQKCHCVVRGVNDKVFKAKLGATVRFGRFTSASLCENVAQGFGTHTVFRVRTCQGASIREFSEYPDEDEVLIPPFETFNVTKVIPKGDEVEIHLNSTGTYSKYNCEWVTGGDSLGT
ncbi:PREDICTED: GPI-linked NAD(P)(+)--arginine ADP-ribosyltransferase 1, partial [Sturnus vulgaris]|uniref:GPI-linked NAD(P)(+)--arginine ADP-ribosyltransferase 1 n=1 Tax=Sturnus vulgaris TaxID=9172 RepID=UPI00071A505E